MTIVDISTRQNGETRSLESKSYTNGKIERDGIGWRWEPERFQEVSMLLDSLEYHGNDLHGELRVRVNDRHQLVTRFNLSRVRDRQEICNQLLRSTSPNGDVNRCQWPWLTLVEQFCAGVIIKEREGEILKYTHKAPNRQRSFLVDKLVMKDKTNLVFAPGGHGKGILAVAMTVGTTIGRGIGELTVQKATPIYFDWEDQFGDYEDRVNLCSTGMGIEVPEIAYQRMHRTVTDSVQLMVNKIRESRANFGVIDSMSAAAGTAGDKGGGWDSISHRFFDALDYIPTYDNQPMTWLIIGHVSGEGLYGLVGKVFGSIQTMNRVRNAWEMRSTQEPGSSTVHMRLHDAKWNHTGYRKPLGFVTQWTQDSFTINSEDPDEINALGKPAQLRDRIYDTLLKDAMTTEALAAELHCSEGRIRATLSSNVALFRRNDRGKIENIYKESIAANEGPLPW